MFPLLEVVQACRSLLLPTTLVFCFVFFCNFFKNTLLTIKHTEHYIHVSWLQGNIAWLTNNT